MIQLQQASLSLSNQLILDQASCILHSGQKIALVGKNGSGKTTLLRLINQYIALDNGELLLKKNIEMAYLRQEIEGSSLTALEYALKGDKTYSAIQHQLQEAEASKDTLRVTQLHQQMEDINGYSIPAEAAKICHGLGFSQADLNQPVAAFSGGWQMRLNLAQMLLSRAELLLLDEPTNHLDMPAIIWLESKLKESKKTLLLISHDRDFIDQVATGIWHLCHKKINTYTGNYSSFIVQYEQQKTLAAAQFAQQQAARKHMEQFVERFRYKASKAKQAQSRIKQLEKMTLSSPLADEKKFHIQFQPVKAVGNPILAAKGLCIGFDDTDILSAVSFSVQHGDRIGLIGPNGAGKSTLIKCISGALNARAGTLDRSPQLKIGYFAQHQLEHMSADQNPLEYFHQKNPAVTEAKARSYLGQFGFTAASVFQKIQLLSGGEKARLRLALLIWDAPNLLLLDEPTNHMDIEIRESLIFALNAYNGSILAISHDRHFLNSVVDALWQIDNGTVCPFDGDLKTYESLTQKKNKAVKPATNTQPTAHDRAEKKSKKNPIKQKQLEDTLMRLEQEKVALQEIINHPQFYKTNTPAEIEAKTQCLASLEHEITSIENTLIDYYE